jgi:hypothetical protein
MFAWLHAYVLSCLMYDSTSWCMSSAASICVRLHGSWFSSMKFCVVSCPALYSIIYVLAHQHPCVLSCIRMSSAVCCITQLYEYLTRLHDE